MTSEASPAGSRLYRILKLERAESLPVIGLFTLSFLFGVFDTFYFTFAYTSFLSHPAFNESRSFLPLSYIASGIAGLLVFFLIERAQSRIDPARLLWWIPVFMFAVTLGLLWVDSIGPGGSDIGGSRWLPFCLFALVHPFSYLLDLVLSSLAARMFDVGQGKRAFPLIFSGEAIAAILSFGLVTQIAAPRLLLIAVLVGLAPSLVVLRFILRLQAARAPTAQAPTAHAPTAHAHVGPPAQKVGEPLNDSYTVLLAAMAVLSVVTLYFVDFAFLLTIKTASESVGGLKDLLAVFWAIAESSTWIVRRFGSGRILNRFGVRGSLLVLPVICLVPAVAALFSGAGNGISALAVLVILIKLFEYVGRRGVFDLSFKTLFFAFPEELRFSIQNRVLGTFRLLALVLAGTTLFLVTELLGSGIDALTTVLLLVAVGFGVLIVLAVGSLSAYRRKLLETLHNATPVPLLSSFLAVIEKELQTFTALGLGYAFNVLEKVESHLLERVLDRLVRSTHIPVRTAALERIYESHMLSHRGAILQMLKHEAEPALIERARDVLKSIDDATTESITQTEIESMLEQGDPSKQYRALRIIEERGIAPSAQSLLPLLEDEDPRIRQLALTVAGSSKDPVYWPVMIEQLGVGETCRAATVAMVSVGASIVVHLEAQLNDPVVGGGVKLRILRILEQIGGADVQLILFGTLMNSERSVRNQAMHSLGVLGFVAEESQVPALDALLDQDLETIEWLLLARQDLDAASVELRTAKALENELDCERDILYLRLAARFDPPSVRLIRDNIDSDQAELQAYAVEIADLMLPHALKERVVGILKQTGPRPQKRGPELREPEAFEKRLLQIAGRDSRHVVNVWTRACAVSDLKDYLLGSTGGLASDLADEEFLVQQLFSWALHQHSPEELADYLQRLSSETATRITIDIALHENHGEGGTLIFEKALRLRLASIFDPVPDDVLVRFAERASEELLEKDQVLIRQGEVERAMYVILDGVFDVERGGVRLNQIRPLDIVGEMAMVESQPRTATVRATEPGRVLRVHRDDFFDLMSDHMELLPDVVRIIAQRRETHRPASQAVVSGTPTWHTGAVPIR